MNKFTAFSALLFSCCAVFAQTSDATANPPVRSAVTTTEAPEVKEFQKVEDKWSSAINARDQYALELVLSPLFVDIAASGDITSRNQQLAHLISTDDKSLSIDQRVITVRMLGDIAVANGTYDLHRKGSSGPVDERGVFTHVFQRVHNGWLCVNSQRTLLREDNPNAKKVKKKGSDAELPFRIPLFSHNSDKTDDKKN